MNSLTSARTLGFVFDLDQTLAPDTTTQYLRSRAIDIAAFWHDVEVRMRQGWDQVPAYLFGLWLESERTKTVSQDELSAVGRAARLFPGALDLIPRLREKFSRSGWSVEFYLISSGLAPIVRSLSIASHFDGIWTSDFEYGSDGRPLFPKRVVSFTDKTRPLIEISKGIPQSAAAADPFLVNRRIEGGAFRIPFRRMIFTGDGLTDVPCFAMVTSRGGSAIAVFDRSRPGAEVSARAFLDSGRVATTAVADYTPAGEAFLALVEAGQSLIANADPPRN